MTYKLGDEVQFFWARGLRHTGRIVGRTFGPEMYYNIHVKNATFDFMAKNVSEELIDD